MIIQPYTHTKPHRGTSYDTNHEQVQGLVAWYRLAAGRGDKAYDEIGSNHGDMNNFANPATPSSGWNPGQFGSALAFDGSDDFADVDDTNNDALDMGTHDMSLSVWIKPEAKTAFILNKRNVAGEVGYDMFYNTGTQAVTARIGDGASELSASSANGSVPAGIWTYIIAVYDRAANLTIYVNGLPSGTPTDITSKSGSQTNTHNFTIGDRNQAGNHLFFLGLMDGIRVLNYAVPQPLIERIMNDPSAMFKRRVFFDMAVAEVFVPQVIMI